MVLPLLGAILIYVSHNLKVLTALDLQAANLLAIDERAFQGGEPTRGSRDFTTRR